MIPWKVLLVNMVGFARSAGLGADVGAAGAGRLPSLLIADSPSKSPLHHRSPHSAVHLFQAQDHCHAS